MKRFFLGLGLVLALAGGAAAQTTPTFKNIKVTSPGSTGDFSAVTVVNGANSQTLATMLGNVVNNSTAITALAPLANPTFTGGITTPKITLSGSGSSGDISAMSATSGGTTQSLATWLGSFITRANLGDLSSGTVTASGSGAANSLAGLFYSPTFTSTATAGGFFTAGAPIQAALGGLTPVVGVGVNLTGNLFANQIAPPSGAIGPSNKAMAGFYSNVTSNNGYIAGNRTNNFSNYRASILSQITAYPNSPDVFGVDVQVNHDQSAPADISVIGMEIDMAKNGSRDCNNLGGPVYCAGMFVTSSTDGTSLFGPAYLVEGQANSFHYGYVVNGSGVKDVGFFDAGSSTTSINIAGSHTTGISISGTISGNQISGTGWAVNNAGGINGASGTFPIMVSTTRTQVAAGAPASVSSACTAGEIKINTDSNIYFCTTTNTWRRVAGTAF